MNLLPPERYTGELLCNGCAQGQETGNYYAICADTDPLTWKLYEHSETCATYNYMPDLGVCPDCERRMPPLETVKQILDNEHPDLEGISMIYTNTIEGRREWYTPKNSNVWTVPGGAVMIRRIEPGNLTPQEARHLAQALRDAADYAETQPQPNTN